MPTSPNSRAIWQMIEPLHAVNYFSDAASDTFAGLGLKGFWMGYFAGRAAPLGPCGPTVVEATFYNFAPGRVRRALPDAWSRTSPEAVLAGRAHAAALVLRRVVPEVDELTRRALPLLESAAAAARCEGRVLAAANQALPPLTDPVERLWQACTTLREHRGDGHVAALVACDVGGLEALVLAAACAPGAAGAPLLQQARGWTAEEWDACRGALTERGLLDEDHLATDEAHLLHARVERITDDAAVQPYRDGLTEPGLDLLTTVLRPFSRAVMSSGLLPFPNPIGLPQPPSGADE